MARFKEAEDRLFTNVWICRKCNAKNRARAGEKPQRCRKCKSHDFRLKHKVKKSAK